MDQHDKALQRAKSKLRASAFRREHGTRDHTSIARANVVSTSEIPGEEIIESLGLVTASVARANHILRDLASVVRDDIGGRMGALTKLADEARLDALTDLRANAGKIGADGIVAVSLSVTAPTNSVLIVTATGTAVRLADEEPASDATTAPAPLSP